LSLGYSEQDTSSVICNRSKVLCWLTKVSNLTDNIFETGASGVPSKSQKSFICGGVKQTITLKSPGKGAPPQPSPGGYSDYPSFGCSAKNQVLRLALDFLFLSEISSRNPFTTTWYQWRSSINWQNKVQKCSKLKFLKFEICKTFLNNKINTFYFLTYFLTSLLHLWILINFHVN
jgi:hypothetical protein